MIWRERNGAADDDPGRRFGRPGGDWQGVRPSLDNPMTWSLPIGRVAGITVRIHLLFLLFVVIILLRSIVPPGEGESFSLFGFAIMAVGLLCLFVIVLAHEFGHCIACRYAGGQADEILIWPLGGLAFCRPANRWNSHLITVMGGPAVNVILCVAAGVMLGLATGRWLGVALPSPFVSPYATMLGNDLSRSWALIGLFLIQWTSLILLLFNLLPIFPLDGGRIVQACLWSRLGYARSMRIAVRVGYVGAILLGVMGFVLGHVMLVMIAVFGGITCYITHKQLQFTEQTMGFASDEYALSLHDAEPVKPSRRQRRAERRARREQQEMQQVDGILQKIAESGIDTLSGAEKRLLRRVTRRKQQHRQ